MRRSKRRRIASLDAMDVATRFVNAANQHDPDGLVACVHRDFQSIQPVHPTRNFRGVGQLRSNWEAIFRTEPGFRLTVLRATATDDTVWMELHGAGDDEEAAGTFILGIENGRIRWIRVYSDIVEPAPEPVVEAQPPSEWQDMLVAVPDFTVTDDHPSDEDGENPPIAEDDDQLSAEGEEPQPGDDGQAVAETDGDDGQAVAETDGDDGQAVAETDGDEDASPAPRRSRFRLLRGKAKT